jgi:protein MAK16
MVRIITASFTSYVDFIIPKNLPLLSVDDNEAVTEENVPFSWWVKWGTLHYYDADGEVHDIQLNSESNGGKRPNDFEDEDDGEEYEDEEEEEEKEDSDKEDEDEDDEDDPSSEVVKEDTICPLCNKDTENDISDINRCKTCDTNIGCQECTQCYDKKETNYCKKHEDDYDSENDEVDYCE